MTWIFCKVGTLDGTKENKILQGLYLAKKFKNFEMYKRSLTWSKNAICQGLYLVIFSGQSRQEFTMLLLKSFYLEYKQMKQGEKKYVHKRNYMKLKKDINNIEKFQEEKLNFNPIFKYN